MNTAVEKEGPLSVLDQMRYRAARNFPDPRSYEAFYTKHLYPKKYLDAIGIEVFVDHILNQFSPKEIAVAYCISQNYLLRWVQADPVRKEQWDWALEQEADNMMFEARDMLKNAFAPPDKALDKAEKLANHNRLMAKGFGAKRWGQKVDVSGLPAGATVTYNFNVALLPEQKEKLVEQKKRTIEGKKEEETVQFDFKNYLGSGLDAVDLTIPKEDMGYEEAKAQES